MEIIINNIRKDWLYNCRIIFKKGFYIFQTNLDENIWINHVKDKSLENLVQRMYLEEDDQVIRYLEKKKQRDRIVQELNSDD